MEKIKKIADNKATWLFIGTMAGSLWGDNAANAVGALGQLVMAVL